MASQRDSLDNTMLRFHLARSADIVSGGSPRRIIAAPAGIRSSLHEEFSDRMFGHRGRFLMSWKEALILLIVV